MDFVEVGEDRKRYAFTNEGDSLSSEIDSDSESSCNCDSRFQEPAPFFIPTEMAIALPELDAKDVFDFEKEKNDRLISMKIACLALSQQKNDSDCIKLRKQLWKLWHTQIPQTHPRIIRSGNYIQDFWEKKSRAKQISQSKINESRCLSQPSSTAPERSSNLKQPRKAYKRLRKTNGRQLRWSTGNALDCDTEDEKIVSQPITQSTVSQSKSAWMSQKNKKRRPTLKSRNKSKTNGNIYQRNMSPSLSKAKSSIRANDRTCSASHSVSRSEQSSLLTNSITTTRKKTTIEEAHITKSDSKCSILSEKLSLFESDKTRKSHDQKRNVDNFESEADSKSKASSSQESNDEIEEFEEIYDIESKILSSYPSQSISSSFLLQKKYHSQQHHSQHKPRLEFHTPHGTTNENKIMTAPKSLPTPKTKYSNSSEASKTKRRKSFQHSRTYRRRLTQRTLDWT